LTYRGPDFTNFSETVKYLFGIDKEGTHYIIEKFGADSRIWEL